MRKRLLLASAAVALFYGPGAAWAAGTREETGYDDPALDAGPAPGMKSKSPNAEARATEVMDASASASALLSSSPGLVSNMISAPVRDPSGALTSRGGIVMRYEPSDFARFQPATALDMVRQLPGFTLDEGETVRGLAGGYGNVLIDGRAPSSKSESIKDRLARIPAAQVRAIEVMDVAVSALVASRQGLVANVITAPAGGPSGAVTLGVTAADAAGGGNLELEAQDGDDALTRKLSASVYRESARPPKGRRLRASPLSEAELFDHSENRGFNGQGTIAWEGTEGSRLEVGLNGAYDRGGSLSEIRPSSVELLERYRSRYVSKKAEATATYANPIGERTALEVTVLHSATRSETRDAAELATYQALSLYDAESSESVLRGTLTRRTPGSLAFSVGAEAAFNRLDGRSGYVEGGQAVALPSQDVEVSERRGEAFARLKGPLSQAWSYELGVTVEAAKLRLKGAPSGRSTFQALRPDAALVFTPDPASRVSLSLTRRVGQLDFSDFVTSVGLEERTVALGAPRLEPVRRWRLELAYRRTFLKDGALDLTLAGERIDNPQELVPLAGQDAPGNLNAADVHKASASLTLPLRGLGGLKGATLSGSVHHQRSEVRDPVTGELRRLSGEVETTGELRFRQDIPNRRLSWGVDLQANSSSRSYRLRQVKSYRPDPYWGADLEYRPGDRWSLRIRLQGGGSAVTKRTVYSVRRGDGSPVFMERRDTRGGLLAYFTVRKSM